jgi:geranylgeranyl pyrophosphate synthase
LSENLDNFSNYSKYADNIGLAFQIKDDILDEE